MSWFAELFGFSESEAGVRKHLSLDEPYLHSSANGRSFTCGRLEVPTLHQLRADARAAEPNAPAGSPRVREVIADATTLHADPANAGTLFQVASQANLLEMISPDVTPDLGITRYSRDPTQGPACAMACAAGTVQRNWFAQSTKHQIDTLAGVGEAIGNEPDQYGRGRWWEMRNGYALLSGEVPGKLSTARGELAIGLQVDTEVTLPGAGHLVSQAYCSALPIAYSSVEPAQVEPLARMVLNSTYEATLAAAVCNAARPEGSPTVFLTLVGGGVFGNPVSWIVDAIDSAIRAFSAVALDVAIVSFRRPNPTLGALLR